MLSCLTYFRRLRLLAAPPCLAMPPPSLFHPAHRLCDLFQFVQAVTSLKKKRDEKPSTYFIYIRRMDGSAMSASSQGPSRNFSRIVFTIRKLAKDLVVEFQVQLK